MYLPADHTTSTDYPRGSTIAENDWHILAAFWHPVAFSSEVTDKPVASRLLDVMLVIYRTETGIVVARDKCPHRGSKLSLGWMDDARENIVCPFHGNHYNSKGSCTLIPSMDQAKPIPKRMCLKAYPAEERYGIIWACLKDTAERPLPEWTLLENHGEEWLLIQLPKGKWQASASRHCENFNDIAHLSWVHMKTFGNRNRPEIPDYQLDKTEFGLRMELPYIEVERGFNDDQLGEREVYYAHNLTYPFATDLRVNYESNMISHFYDIGSPVSATETDIYQLTLTNIPGATAEDYAEYQLVTNSEDITVVESQQPMEVPMNPGEEVHIPADKFSIQYRRDLQEIFGLGVTSSV